MKLLRNEFKWKAQYYCDEEMYDLLLAIHKKQLTYGVNEAINKLVNETLLDNKRNEINVETAELHDWYYYEEEDVYSFQIIDADYTMYHFIDDVQVGISHLDTVLITILVDMNTKQTALFCVYGYNDEE